MDLLSDFGNIKESLNDINGKLGQAIEMGEEFRGYAEEFSEIKDEIKYIKPLYENYKEKLSKIQKNSGRIFILVIAILVTLMMLMFSFNNVMVSIFKTTQKRLIYFGIVAFIFVFMVYKLYKMVK